MYLSIICNQEKKKTTRKKKLERINFGVRGKNNMKSYLIEVIAISVGVLVLIMLLLGYSVWRCCRADRTRIETNLG